MCEFLTNFGIYLSCALVVIGSCIVLLWFINYFHHFLDILRNILCCCAKCQKSESLQEKYGEWAVITGATDGLGKQYSIELAKKGMNICLISRSEAKLIEVSNEIEQNHKVSTKFIVADFSKGISIYDQIKVQLSKIDIGILINNVGVMHHYPDEFDKISEESLWDMINVNIGAVTLMSRIVIPMMKAKNRGLILNVSSGSQEMPTPLAAVYAASKIYIKNFTLAIQQELSEFNIKFHLLIPMFIKTNMTHYSKIPECGNIFYPNAETYVQAAINTLGKYSETCGYWNHSIQYMVVCLTPELLRTLISQRLNRLFRQQYHDQKNEMHVTLVCE